MYISPSGSSILVELKFGNVVLAVRKTREHKE